MFSITVRSEKEDKRIPIAVASDVMFDIQLLLTHIGESFIAHELDSQDRPSEALTERFTLFIDPDSGISYRTCAGKGKSGLMDRAAAMLITTLEKMGSGSGTYWMEDNFKDPRYRCMVLTDLIHLSRHMSEERGYTLLFSSDGKENKFVPMDTEKAEAFLKSGARISQMNAAGVLNSIHTKRNVPLYSFSAGADKARVSFRSKDAEADASQYAGGAAVISGTMKYSEDGELLDVHDVTSVLPFDKITFRHIISADRDIPLNSEIEVSVKYDTDTAVWKLSYSDLGISVSNKDRDAASAEFHDYFAFLCDNYLSDEEKELSGEEKEVKELLISLTRS
jgi:hypothetical protein